MSRKDFDLSPWDASVWDGKPAGQYCAACLIDENPKGAKKVKDKCHLPVKKPGSKKYNLRAVFAAAGGRGITRLKGVSAEAKRKAARRIISLYRKAGEIAPASIYRIAGMKRPTKKK